VTAHASPMSAFKKPLPLQIFSSENSKRNVFVKAFFESMEPSQMKIKLNDSKAQLEFGSDISIEFTVANHRYQFDSVILSDVQNRFLFVRKPKVLYKKSLLF
jgi:hypothetical protein